MADQNTSLPIRTEANGDVAAKIVDGTVTSQALGVDSSGRITTKIQDSTGDALDSTGGALHVADGGGSLTVDATNLDIRDLTHVSDSVKVGDGTDFLAVNADGSVNITDNGGSLTVDASDLDIRDLSHTQDSVKIGDGTDFLGVNTDGSININLRDESGTAYSASNPLQVEVIEDAGTEVQDYDTQAALAAGNADNHDLPVTGTALKLKQILASASGKMKVELQISNTGSTVFVTKAVFFNSTANPNIDSELRIPIVVPVGETVRLIRTNKDQQSQDVYSTILGVK